MTPVEICNLALGFVGAKPIVSLDDALTTAELCRTMFAPAARTVMERRAWLFATQRLTLEPGEETGDARWPRRFVLPTTVVRVLGVDSGTGEWTARWVREGQAVLTEDALSTVFVRAVVDPGEGATALWTPGFTRAVALRLAADLAGPIAENASLAARLESQYEAAVRVAGTMDGMQGSSELPPPTRAQLARW